MKRPVFCVALAYALGEVIDLYTRIDGNHVVILRNNRRIVADKSEAKRS